MHSSHYRGATPEELLPFLFSIAKNELAIESVVAPVFFDGKHTFTFKNKLSLTIFMDAGEFDYIETAILPDGRKGSVIHWADLDFEAPFSLFADLYSDHVFSLNLALRAGLEKFAGPMDLY